MLQKRRSFQSTSFLSAWAHILARFYSWTRRFVKSFMKKFEKFLCLYQQQVGEFVYGMKVGVTLPEVAENQNWTCEESSSIEKTIIVPYLNQQKLSAMSSIQRLNIAATEADS